MSEVIEPNIFRKIYNIIAKNPGVNVKDIAEILNVNISVIEPYIYSLEEKKEIFTLSEDGCVRYYVRTRRKGSRDRKTHEIRQKILQILYSNPGLHLSKIADMLNMSTGLAKYHLQYMEKNHLIIGIRAERKYYKRFYIKDSGIGAQDKRIVALLRQEQLLKIVVIILKFPNIQHKDLSNLLNIHPSTLTHHIIKLDECGIIDFFTYGNKKGYLIRNKKEIIRIIKSYITEGKIERFKDIWEHWKLRE